MFHEQRLTVPETPAALRESYLAELEALVAAVGPESAAERTGIDAAHLTALASGESVDLSLEEAARVLALDEESPDAETVEIVACEHLLLGMSTAVLDVDTLAGEVALDLDPTEIQQKIERRAPMSFEEYVYLQHAIVDAMP